MAQNNALKAPTQDQIEEMKEIHIEVNWRGLKKFWKMATYEFPFKTYQAVARWADGLTDRMMVGKLAVLGMPLGIVVRNGARSADQLSKGQYAHTAEIAGGLTAATAAIGGGWLLFTKALAPAATALAAQVGVASWLGTGVAAAGTFIIASLLATPAFTLGVLAVSTVISTAVSAVSVVPAAVNLGKGWTRMKNALQGVKFSEKDLAQEAIARDSLHTQYEREIYRQVTNGLYNLPEESRREIFNRLSEELAPPVDNAEKEEQAAQPAAKKRGIIVSG